MGKALPDLTGMVFGQRTVIGPAEPKMFPSGKQLYRTWLCECSCGRRDVVLQSSLSSGNSNRCIDCRNANRSGENSGRWIQDRNRVAARKRMTYYKNNAKVANRVFELSEDEFVDLVLSDCYYCGAKPGESRSHQHFSKNSLPVNGIDRIDSSGGYTRENARSCCPRCNVAKSVHSEDDFIAMCHTVASRHPPATTPQTASVLHWPWADRNIDASPLQWAVQ